jgi:hypothetical protein
MDVWTELRISTKNLSYYHDDILIYDFERFMQSPTTKNFESIVKNLLQYRILIYPNYFDLIAQSYGVIVVEQNNEGLERVRLAEKKEEQVLRDNIKEIKVSLFAKRYKKETAKYELKLLKEYIQEIH